MEHSRMLGQECRVYVQECRPRLVIIQHPWSDPSLPLYLSSSHQWNMNCNHCIEALGIWEEMAKDSTLLRKDINININHHKCESSYCFEWAIVLLLLSCSVMSDSFVTPWTVSHQAPLSMGFPRQEYRSGLPFPSPGDLPDPGTKPASSASQADSLLLNQQGSPKWVTGW